MSTYTFAPSEYPGQISDKYKRKMHLSKLQRCTEILHKRFNTWHPKKPHSKSSFPWHWLVKGDIWHHIQSRTNAYTPGRFFLVFVMRTVANQGRAMLGKTHCIGCTFQISAGWVKLWSVKIDILGATRILQASMSPEPPLLKEELEARLDGDTRVGMGLNEFFNIFLGVGGQCLDFIFVIGRRWHGGHVKFGSCMHAILTCFWFYVFLMYAQCVHMFLIFYGCIFRFIERERERGGETRTCR